MPSLIASILIVLIFTGVACLLFREKMAGQKVLAVVGAVVFVALSLWLVLQVQAEGIQTYQAAGLEAPFGITLVADMLASLMLLASAVVALVCLLYTFHEGSPGTRQPAFLPVFFMMMFGIAGALLAGDIFNLYVWFEVLLVGSFVLLAIGGSRPQLEGAIKYVVINFVGSGFLLLGVGILYKLTGHLNMAMLAQIVPQGGQNGLFNLAAVFFFTGFGIKAAVFPLFFWLPASYHTPPVGVSALMAGLLTKVGMYTLFRFFTLIFINDLATTHFFLLVISGITMLSGVLGAIAQHEMRKLLSFHIVSQIGYMLMGLALFTPAAMAAAIYFLLHNILAKTSLFLISGLVRKLGGSFVLEETGGLYRRYPLVAGLFLLSALSLAGIPPLSGFWGKLLLAMAGFEVQQYVVVGISLLTGFLTLFSMSKIWEKVFWQPAPKGQGEKPGLYPEAAGFYRSRYLMLSGTVLLVLLVLLISLLPAVLYAPAEQAAEQLFDPQGYINAVLR